MQKIESLHCATFPAQSRRPAGWRAFLVYDSVAATSLLHIVVVERVHDVVGVVVRGTACLRAGAGTIPVVGPCGVDVVVVGVVPGPKDRAAQRRLLELDVAITV